MKNRGAIILASFIVVGFPTAIFAATSTVVPERIDPIEIESSIHAEAYVVLDRASGKLLTVKQENKVWPIASLTKLMTSNVILEKPPAMQTRYAVKSIDDVGGAKLYLKNGDKLTIQDLFYAMFLGSANNAANALARTSGLSKTQFVKKMNAKAQTMNLLQTKFTDPTGMDITNVSTPLEMAQIARVAFDQPLVRQYTTTPEKTIRVVNTGVTKKIKNTNWMLTYPEYSDISVTGGKTGYLEESAWNFVTSIRPKSDPNKELLIVVFGAPSRADSFIATKTLADWAWNSYAWKQEYKTASR